MKIIGLVIKAVLVAYLVIFAVNNRDVISMNIFPFETFTNIPIFLFTLILLFIGFFSGVLLMLGERLSVSSQVRKLKKELAEAQSEITKVKNITLTQSEKTPETTELTPAQEKNSANNPDIKEILR